MFQQIVISRDDVFLIFTEQVAIPKVSQVVTEACSDRLMWIIAGADGEGRLVTLQVKDIDLVGGLYIEMYETSYINYIIATLVFAIVWNKVTSENNLHCNFSSHCNIYQTNKFSASSN